MNKYIKIVTVFFLVLILVLIRAYENVLFYDPFLGFFKQDFLINSFPEYNSIRLFFNHIYRFGINSIVSLLIIYVVFENWKLVKFSIWIFIIAFSLFFAAYYFMIYKEFSFGYLIAFYLRRFLIHPLLLIILIPAFYFKKKYTFEMQTK